MCESLVHTALSHVSALYHKPGLTCAPSCVRADALWLHRLVRALAVAVAAAATPLLTPRRRPPLLHAATARVFAVVPFLADVGCGTGSCGDDGNDYDDYDDYDGYYYDNGDDYDGDGGDGDGGGDHDVPTDQGPVEGTAVQGVCRGSPAPMHGWMWGWGR